MNITHEENPACMAFSMLKIHLMSSGGRGGDATNKCYVTMQCRTCLWAEVLYLQSLPFRRSRASAPRARSGAPRLGERGSNSPCRHHSLRRTDGQRMREGRFIHVSCI